MVDRKIFCPLLLAAGANGKRAALPHARIMIHQPLGGVEGQASDIEIHAKEIVKLKEKLNNILSEATGQPIAKIVEDTDRNYFMSAEESKVYGIIDDVLTQRQIASKKSKGKNEQK